MRFYVLAVLAVACSASAFADNKIRKNQIVAFSHQPAGSGAYGIVVGVQRDGFAKVEWLDENHKGLPATIENPRNLIREKKCEQKICRGQRLIYNWEPPSRANVDYVFENGEVLLTISHHQDSRLKGHIAFAKKQLNEKNPNGDPWLAAPVDCRNKFCVGDKAFMVWPVSMPLKILEMYSDGHVYVEWLGDKVTASEGWIRIEDLRKNESDVKEAIGARLKVVRPEGAKAIGARDVDDDEEAASVR